jgi:hypothetical protein
MGPKEQTIPVKVVGKKTLKINSRVFTRPHKYLLTELSFLEKPLKRRKDNHDKLKLIRE